MRQRRFRRTSCDGGLGDFAAFGEIESAGKISRSWLIEQDSDTSPPPLSIRRTICSSHEELSARREADAATQIYVCGGDRVLAGCGAAMGRQPGNVEAGDRRGVQPRQKAARFGGREGGGNERKAGSDECRAGQGGCEAGGGAAR